MENELVTKSEKWNRKPRLECINGQQPPSKTPVDVLPGTCRSEGKRTDRLAGKATLKNGLLLGRSKVMRSLRHYLRTQSQGHHTIYRLEERGVVRGSARRSSLKGRERAIVNRFKGNVGETSERGSGAHMDFFEHIDTILG